MPVPVILPPPPVRPQGLLLDVAQQIPDEAYQSTGASRWALHGVTWNPWVFELPIAEEAQCDTIYDKQPEDIAAPVSQLPFLVWRSLQCSALSGMRDELNGRVLYSVDTLFSASLAVELETGAASGGIGLIGNTDFPPEIVSASPVLLSVALAELEEYLAANLSGAVGVIHLTPALYSIAHAHGLAVNGRTHTGHRLVGDAGHTGSGTPEGGSAPGTGNAWIYATSTVWYDHTRANLTESYGADPGDFDFSRNVDRPLAERIAIVLFDPTVLAAARVDVVASAELVGGS